MIDVVPCRQNFGTDNLRAAIVGEPDEKILSQFLLPKHAPKKLRPASFRPLGDAVTEAQPSSSPRRRSDVPFFLVMGGLSSCFILLIVLLLAADVVFTSPNEFVKALQKPEIQRATIFTFVSCTVAAVMSVWIATPLGYVLSRYKFPGRNAVDTLVDIPIVLPPLVLGLENHRDFGHA